MTSNVPAQWLDDAFEIAVLPSFSRLGPAFRSRLFQWDDMPARSLAGRVAVVTGPTSGIGRAAAFALARAGARLVLVGRSADKLARLAAELSTVARDGIFGSVVADTSALASVRKAVTEIGALTDRVDILVDNAGAIYPEWTRSDDGIEKTLAILVCGPFAMTAGLLPLLRAAGDARVIAVTSGGMYTQPVQFDDLQWRAREYEGARAYAQSKRIQVALIREWARRFGSDDISFNAMHPGWADTPGLAESLPGFQRIMKPLLRTPEEGADTIVWLATTPTLPAPGGRVYLDRRPRPFDRLPQTRLTLAQRAELWDTISELAGVSPG